MSHLSEIETIFLDLFFKTTKKYFVITSREFVINCATSISTAANTTITISVKSNQAIFCNKSIKKYNLLALSIANKIFNG